jgi:RNA polymerase sigma-B factor
MQVGYVGLLKAINKFDPELGASLEAYARPCVSGELKRHFRDKRWQVRVHRGAQELRLRIRDESPALIQELARQPTDADLAAHLEVTEAEIADAQVASQAFQAIHIDTPVAQDGDSGRTLADQMGAEDERLEQTIMMAAVWQHCAELPKREQMMLMMRFYGNMTQTQIGDELGISQMHVSRLLNHALGYLRDRVVVTSD